jgi:hypothetical protein
MTRVLVIAAGLVIAVVAIPNLIVWLGGRSPVTGDAARGPHAQAALLREEIVGSLTSRQLFSVRT